MLRLVKNSLTYGIGRVAQRFLSIFLVPIYTRFLTPEDYGIISILGIISMIVGVLCTCGLSNGIARYYFYTEHENTDKSVVIWSPFLFILFISLFILLGGTILSPFSSLKLFYDTKYAYLIILILIQLLGTNVSLIGRTVLICQQRAMTVNILNLLQVVAGASCGILFVAFFKRGVQGAVEANTIAVLITAIPLLAITVFTFKPTFSFKILKKLLTFSLPLVGTIFAFWFIDSSDRYILSKFLPLSEVGLYEIGYKFALIVVIIINGFTLAWPPYYHKLGGKQTICDDTLKASLFILSICVVLLSISSPLLIRIFTASKFHSAYTIVPLVSFAYLLKIPYLVFIMGIHMKNKTLWLVYLESFAAIVNIIGNILLIPRFGREAAAVTTVISYIIISSGAYIIVQRINPIPGISIGLYIKILTLTLIILCGFMLSNYLHYNYFITSFFLFSLFASGLWVIYGYKEIKRTITIMLQKA